MVVPSLIADLDSPTERNKVILWKQICRTRSLQLGFDPIAKLRRREAYFKLRGTLDGGFIFHSCGRRAYRHQCLGGKKREDFGRRTLGRRRSRAESRYLRRKDAGVTRSCSTWMFVSKLGVKVQGSMYVRSSRGGQLGRRTSSMRRRRWTSRVSKSFGLPCSPIPFGLPPPWPTSLGIQCLVFAFTPRLRVALEAPHAALPPLPGAAVRS